MGAFATLQAAYARYGVATYPVTGGKVPAVRGYGRVGLEGSRQLALKFADADAGGFVAGKRNGIVVVDIDSADDRLVAEVEAKFGATPLQVLTPSGGRHRYYRHSGERRKIRLLQKVDILGAGNVVAAGSVVPKGTYKIERGSLDDLARLPPMRAGEAPRALADDKIGEGYRNKALFEHCMRAVRQCDDRDTLLDVARTFNEDSVAPQLPEAEVITTVRWVWDCEARGVNRFGTTGAWFPTAEVTTLLKCPDATMLLMALRAYNAPGRLFWITNRFSAKFGWGPKRMAGARAQLVAMGYITLVRPATRGSPALYRWTDQRRPPPAGARKQMGGRN
jgi:hypothetical protein